MSVVTRRIEQGTFLLLLNKTRQQDINNRRVLIGSPKNERFNGNEVNVIFVN